MKIESALDTIHGRSVNLAEILYLRQTKSWISFARDISNPTELIRTLPALNSEIGDLFYDIFMVDCLIGVDGALTSIEKLKREDRKAGSKFIVWEGEDWKNLPFKKAIEIFRKKKLIDARSFKEAEAAIKAITFSVQRIEFLNVINAMQKSLDEAFERGITYKDWLNDLPNFFKRIGLARKEPQLTPGHFETVFRTNQHSVYNAAKWGTFQAEDYVDSMRYDTVGDNRVRDEHAALDGLIFKKNDPIWDSIYPPNGYGCRCSTTPLSRYYLEKKNLQYSILTPEQQEAISKLSPDFQGKNGIMAIAERLEKYADSLES
jgi:SPP1 gp7 family putative phage head morphogenesis protein